MNCEKCKYELRYGSKYCTNCGDKVPEGAYEEEYNKSFWGKLDKIHNLYNIVTLKKITGHIIFKIIVLAALIIFILSKFYGEFSNIRLLESDFYSIVYNKTEDEYYINTEKTAVNLELSIPITAQKIVLTGINGDKSEVKELSVDEYKGEGILVEKDKYEHIIIETVRNGKTTDSVKMIVGTEDNNE